ncbi:MAG: phenylacetic acid degradation operon transcriptional regulator, paaX family [Candidatus Berkelbacteria bacterium Licking1014_2]|uniref:Phenylacetic acid degradation operon transcriptional regulator, paaX family n=1 Tax=Candidatus Berkelbacteria bacterium Licking1014_2 TaxID=2017146 RepID=A0A554LVA0_9BACT|nr:MAG: phenylacetic acid degradation operon transcriptional regulator, paaX family [Candidatus Berkelbacteria bacterium Licking1014_2]
MISPFQAQRIYRRSVRNYLRERGYQKSEFLQQVRYWRRQGYINTFLGGRDKLLELTPKGLDYLQDLFLKETAIKRPKRWDGKWRVVIFDIPEKHRSNRNILRERLSRLNFYQIQKSVYVYPFECTNEIAMLCSHFFLTDFVIIMIAEIIQGEEKLVEFFLDKEVLSLTDLDTK